MAYVSLMGSRVERTTPELSGRPRLIIRGDRLTFKCRGTQPLTASEGSLLSGYGLKTQQEDHVARTGDWELDPTDKPSTVENGDISPRREPPCGYRALDFSDIEAPRLTHYLFRFPAKFHPPVVHSLIREYTEVGQTVIDPFCGSGTLLLAAQYEGRNARGSDVDPLAVFVADVKTHRLQPKHLKSSWEKLWSTLQPAERTAAEYSRRRYVDISLREYEGALLNERLWVPVIPNLLHWFRRYVVIDLARMFNRVNQIEIPETHRAFFRLIFASVLRKVSNADPVPVSGLEVTSHMKHLDEEGRYINPVDAFSKAVGKAISSMEAFWEACPPSSRVSVLQADARYLTSRMRSQVDAVITSPPYHNAVDYYRRHQLEMYWLGMAESPAERLDLRPKYIGSPNIRKRDPLLQRGHELCSLARKWHDDIRSVSAKRADNFLHYVVSMKDVFRQLSHIVRRGGSVVFVVGHSEWNGSRIPTSDLFIELCMDSFSLEDKLWYPVKNRYMSYGRRNGADIGEEFVLVFRRSGS